MPRRESFAFNWFDTNKGLRVWKEAQEQFKQMSKPEVVFDSAMAAGRLFKTSIQDLIYSQPSLDPYADVAERIDVWGDAKDNVYVGVKQEDPILSRAQEMDQVFPVLHTAVDLEHQAHKVQDKFFEELIGRVF